ncbi:hypothetical protein VC83_08965 [Pseudogymnoascus destructans]|uniref:Beta-galactosidase domain-containing protein n=1 Tax=Pseudogymnoascus destructans TaxID=655981 RepID=A0A177A189_9PEZI|nr:uncharacterized protein VC83_08965 [Pseudogymnoascus destructans]OAF54714.1 hypothetical protein VC83_08965 [Pseudogymnoascus destructans]
MWIDILQKVKAAGIPQCKGRNFERLFEIAKEVGLYVLFRPGPYVNAKATASRFPGWVTTGAYGRLRNNDTRHTDAWTPYMNRMSQIIAKHQVTNGGNVFIYQIKNDVNNTGPDWVNVFYRHNVAQNIAAANVYMAFGGTTGIPFPGVGTSYDYSAPISETRFVSDKYSETKLFAQFLRVARDLTKVDRVNNGTTYASNLAIMTTELRNSDTNAAFYTAHALSLSTDRSPFKLDVSTSAGRLNIPQNGGDIAVNRRLLSLIFSVGREKLTYSTAEVLTASITASQSFSSGCRLAKVESSSWTV